MDVKQDPSRKQERSAPRRRATTKRATKVVVLELPPKPVKRAKRSAPPAESPVSIIAAQASPSALATDAATVDDFPVAKPRRRTATKKEAKAIVVELPAKPVKRAKRSAPPAESTVSITAAQPSALTTDAATVANPPAAKPRRRAAAKKQAKAIVLELPVKPAKPARPAKRSARPTDDGSVVMQQRLALVATAGIGTCLVVGAILSSISVESLGSATSYTNLVIADRIAAAEYRSARARCDAYEKREKAQCITEAHAAEQQTRIEARRHLEIANGTNASDALAYDNIGDISTEANHDDVKRLPVHASASITQTPLTRALSSYGNRPAHTFGRLTADAAKSAAPVMIAAAPEPKPASKETSVATKRPEMLPTALEPDEVLHTLHGWAGAWAKQDVGAYLSFYAAGFRTPNGESRADWENARNVRITTPKKIEIEIESPKVVFKDGRAMVTFRQLYRSDQLQVWNKKSLMMVHTDGHWLIQEERVGI